MSTKGEAIALAIAQMTTSTIATCDHGIVTRTKRVIMDRDVYEKKWKLGPFSKKKADLKGQGKLDKYGRMTDNTPEAWKLLFGDDTKAAEKAEEPVKEKKDKKEKKEKKAKKEKKEKKSKKAADSEEREEGEEIKEGCR